MKNLQKSCRSLSNLIQEPHATCYFQHQINHLLLLQLFCNLLKILLQTLAHWFHPLLAFASVTTADVALIGDAIYWVALEENAKRLQELEMVDLMLEVAMSMKFLHGC